MENQASYIRCSWFLLQCSLSLCQVLSYMLFFMFSGLRWESSGHCCLTEKRKRTESAWRTTSDHHSHWKAGQSGHLLSSLFAYWWPRLHHQLWSPILQDTVLESPLRLKLLADDLEHSLTLTLSSLNPRVYILDPFSSTLIRLVQADSCCRRYLCFQRVQADGVW